MCAGQVAIALYTFEGSPADGTLAVTEGARMTIVAPDSGDGWIEARLDDGTTGLVPSSYVEIKEEDIPPLSDFVPPSPMPPPAEAFGAAPPITEFALPDPISDVQPAGAPASPPTPVEPESEIDYDADDPNSIVTEVCSGWLWPDSDPLECTVTSPTMHKGGIGKGFITYDVTTIPGGTTVQRRFKDFLWLYEYLTGNFPTICIPPLPPKQSSGRFEEDFIEYRRIRLEQFLNRIARHPILRCNEGFELFLASENDKEFVQSKKMLDKVLEKDKGYRFLNGVREAERREFDDEPSTKHLEKFKSSLVHFDNTLNGLKDATSSNLKQHEVAYKELKKLGTAFSAMAGTAEGQNPLCWREGCDCVSLADSLRNLSKCCLELHDISHRHDPHYTTFVDELAEYSGLIPKLNEVLKVRDTANRENHSTQARLAKNVSPSPNDKMKAAKTRKKAESCTFALMCEQELFHSNRVVDLRKFVIDFVKAQVAHHKKMSETWESALASLESVSSAVGDKTVA